MKKYLLFFVVIGAVILVAYEALIYYDTWFPYGRMWETPAVKPHEEPPLVMWKNTVPYDGGEAVFRVTPADLLKSPFSLTNAETVERGKVLYDKFCAQCHGKNHDGNATVGQSFHPLPTDLRSAKVRSLSEGAFFKEISYGIPDGRQPPLATTIEALDRWRIIAYVRSLGPRK